MTVELSPNSRFTILDNPNREPGVCAVCGSAGGDDRKFVDFGKQLDWYGAVYFCTHCVIELAASIGFIESAPHEALKKLNESEVHELNVTIESFRDYREATRTMLRNCSCADSDGSTSDPESSLSKPKRGQQGKSSDNSDLD